MKSRAVESEAEVATTDRAMTLDRDEIKYVIHPLGVTGLLRILQTKLIAHRFTGQGANRLPDAQHFTSTVYFDTSTRALYRAALRSPDHNTKLRVRSYYDLHSSLAELSTSSDQFVRYQPWLFVELKRRADTRTFKQRLRLARAELSSFMAQLELPAQADGPAPTSDGADILAFARSLAEPVAPSCLVSYRRLSFEDADSALRVTLDLDVSFYAPPAQLFSGEQALLRSSLGKPAGSAPLCLVEVKRRGEAPAWLTRTLDDTGAQKETFSKFMLASEAVHGRT